MYPPKFPRGTYVTVVSGPFTDRAGIVVWPFGRGRYLVRLLKFGDFALTFMEDELKLRGDCEQE